MRLTPNARKPPRDLRRGAGRLRVGDYAALKTISRSRSSRAVNASIRLNTSEKDGRLLKRMGYATQTAASDAREDVRDLVKLARDDDRLCRKIGDLIFEKTKRGGQLPSADEVRRRLGVGRDPERAGETFGEAWATYIAAKKRARRPSTMEALENRGRCRLLPVLEDIALDRITAEHCLMVFERIDILLPERNAANGRGHDRAFPVRSHPADRRSSLDSPEYRA